MASKTEELELRFNSVNDIKKFSLSRGSNWFSPNTLRFFQSRFSQTVYGGRIFVSSEMNFDGTQRLYTVRFVKADGGVETIGEFQQYETLAQAQGAARRAAREWVETGKMPRPTN